MESPLERIKDHATFLAAAVHLAPLYPPARFVLMIEGSADAVAKLRVRAAQAGVLERMILVDDLSVRAQWLQAADVAVLTSMSEGCSDTLLSYMAAGLPIVATSVGGNPELIRHGESGYLFDPGEADALAMRINILLLADDLASRFGAAARERARTEFTAENEVRRFADLYRTLVYTSLGARAALHA
jgi:glycosyltransferase involved in cell wall biosynthesis